MSVMSTMTWTPEAHPRATDGTFTEKPLSAAEVALEPAAPAAPAAPAQVLERWGITPEQLPGFEAAWHERFAGLDDAEETEYVGSVLGELLDLDRTHPDYLDASVVVEGNDVFANIVIATPSGVQTIRRDLTAEGLTTDELRRAVNAEAQRERHVELAQLRIERENLNLGHTAPWHLLADQVELARAAGEAGVARGQEMALRARAMEADEFERHRDALRAGAVLDRGFMLDGPYIRTPMSMGEAADILTASREAELEFERAAQAVREAEALPPGPERDARLSPWSGRDVQTAKRRALARIAETQQQADQVEHLLSSHGAAYVDAREQLAEAVRRTDAAMQWWWTLGAPAEANLPAAPELPERA